LVFIVLERSNSGRNSYYIMGDVESDVRALLEKIGRAWEKHMISVKEAEQLFNQFFRSVEEVG
jgi:hypothetical protein